ncbi:MAG: hypothetical protein Q8936_14980 [Bacillota bacterium]|nr:hypothetical protein [Bacillota bacterium]
MRNRFKNAIKGNGVDIVTSGKPIPADKELVIDFESFLEATEIDTGFIEGIKDMLPKDVGIKLKFYQLVYTISESGFQTYSMSPEITEDEREEIEEICYYEPPTKMLEGKLDEASLKNFPVSFSFFKLRSGRLAVAQTKFTGKDYGGGNGGYFSHVLVLESGYFPFYPIQLMDSPSFRSSLTEEEKQADGIVSLPALNEVILNEDLSFEKVSEFIKEEDGENLNELKINILKNMINIMIQNTAQERRIIVCDEKENLKHWIAAIQMSLPLKLAQLNSFTAYVHEPMDNHIEICGMVREDLSIVEKYKNYNDYYVFDIINNIFPRAHIDTKFSVIIQKMFLSAKKRKNSFMDFVNNFELSTLSKEIDDCVELYNIISTGLSNKKLKDIVLSLEFIDRYASPIIKEELSGHLEDLILNGSARGENLSEDILKFRFKMAVENKEKASIRNAFSFFYKYVQSFLTRQLGSTAILRTMEFYEKLKANIENSSPLLANYTFEKEHLLQFIKYFDRNDPKYAKFYISIVLDQLTKYRTSLQDLDLYYGEFIKAAFTSMFDYEEEIIDTIKKYNGIYAASLTLMYYDVAIKRGISTSRAVKLFINRCNANGREWAQAARQYLRDNDIGRRLLFEEFRGQISSSQDKSALFWSYYNENFGGQSNETALYNAAELLVAENMALDVIHGMIKAAEEENDKAQLTKAFDVVYYCIELLLERQELGIKDILDFYNQVRKFQTSSVNDFLTYFLNIDKLNDIKQTLYSDNLRKAEFYASIVLQGMMLRGDSWSAAAAYKEFLDCCLDIIMNYHKDFMCILIESVSDKTEYFINMLVYYYIKSGNEDDTALKMFIDKLDSAGYIWSATIRNIVNGIEDGDKLLYEEFKWRLDRAEDKVKFFNDYYEGVLYKIHTYKNKYLSQIIRDYLDTIKEMPCYISECIEILDLVINEDVSLDKDILTRLVSGYESTIDLVEPDESTRRKIIRIVQIKMRNEIVTKPDIISLVRFGIKLASVDNKEALVRVVQDEVLDITELNKEKYVQLINWCIPLMAEHARFIEMGDAIKKLLYLDEYKEEFNALFTKYLFSQMSGEGNVDEAEELTEDMENDILFILDNASNQGDNTSFELAYKMFFNTLDSLAVSEKVSYERLIDFYNGVKDYECNNKEIFERFSLEEERIIKLTKNIIMAQVKTAEFYCNTLLEQLIAHDEVDISLSPYNDFFSACFNSLISNESDMESIIANTEGRIDMFTYLSSLYYNKLFALSKKESNKASEIFVSILDSSLQDKEKEIIDMIAKTNNGFLLMFQVFLSKLASTEDKKLTFWLYKAEVFDRFLEYKREFFSRAVEQYINAIRDQLNCPEECGKFVDIVNSEEVNFTKEVLTVIVGEYEKEIKIGVDNSQNDNLIQNIAGLKDKYKVATTPDIIRIIEFDNKISNTNSNDSIREIMSNTNIEINGLDKDNYERHVDWTLYKCCNAADSWIVHSMIKKMFYIEQYSEWFFEKYLDNLRLIMKENSLEGYKIFARFVIAFYKNMDQFTGEICENVKYSIIKLLVEKADNIVKDIDNNLRSEVSSVRNKEVVLKEWEKLIKEYNDIRRDKQEDENKFKFLNIFRR